MITIKELIANGILNSPEFRERYDESAILNGVWWHSFRLPDGRVINGKKTLEILDGEFDEIFSRVNVEGKSLLDIGAWNGAFSFEAKRRGAADVLATDYFTWVMPVYDGYTKFDYIRRQTQLDVKSLCIDIPDIAAETIGRYDIVLFLGVFYHLPDPLAVLNRLFTITKDTLVVETYLDALDVPYPAMRYYPKTELAGDETSWWGPNPACMQELLLNCGFKSVEYYPGKLGPRGLFLARKHETQTEGVSGYHKFLVK